MALSYKARRRWALFILLIGMPVYIVVVITIVNRLDLSALPGLVQFVVYVVLGVAWVLPFKSIFLGIGQADPDAKDQDI